MLVRSPIVAVCVTALPRPPFSLCPGLWRQTTFPKLAAGMRGVMLAHLAELT